MCARAGACCVGGWEREGGGKALSPFATRLSQHYAVLLSCALHVSVGQGQVDWRDALA